MANQRNRDLNNTGLEGPGGTQLTHAARRGGGVQDVNVEGMIRDHPVLSIALALLGGFLIAKLLD